MQKSLQFQFSGKMARLLGRESVSSDVAALLELVKNGYDADASSVRVIFEGFSPEERKNGRIIVEDDGEGMTFDAIQNRWMVIGTDFKERETFTKQRHRRVIGNKGVGRFATEKLCRKLTMISNPKNSNEEITVNIDWDKYEQKDVTFADINNPIQIIQNQNRNSGVKIILENLRDMWTNEKLEHFRTSVGSLILPPQLSKVTNDPFKVEIFAKDFTENAPIIVQSTLLKYAPYIINATIKEKQTFFKIKIRNEKRKTVREEEIDLGDTIMENGELWKPFGNCRFRMYFFPGESKYEKWNKYYRKVLKINRIQETLENTHGTKIYRDGFWVRPYGDIGNDWLALEQKRVQANYKIGNSQSIGFVEITKDGNPEILDTTTRERLAENMAYNSMRTFVQEVVESMNNYRKDLNKKLKANTTKKEHHNILDSEIKHLKETIDKNENLILEDKRKINHSLSEITKTWISYEDETEENVANMEESQQVYRKLASLGISSATTAHEIKHTIGELGMIPKTILTKLKTHAESKLLVTDDIQDALTRINTIRYFMKFIMQFVETLAYDSEIKHEKETFKIKPILDIFLKYFLGMLNMRNTTISYNLHPENISVYMNKADFESIILNLLSNSFKAIYALPKKSSGKIKINISKDAKKFKLKFSDNGIGIKERNRDKIFRLFFTTNKQGTGLGLPIIREMLEDYDGKIVLLDKSELDNGATFEITIPLKEMKR